VENALDECANCYIINVRISLFVSCPSGAHNLCPSTKGGLGGLGVWGCACACVHVSVCASACACTSRLSKIHWHDSNTNVSLVQFQVNQSQSLQFCQMHSVSQYMGLLGLIVTLPVAWQVVCLVNL